MKRTTRLAEPPRADGAHDEASAVDETVDVQERETRGAEPWGGEESEAPAAAAEDAELDTGNAPDDALGLYLRQMGAIPLLNRDQELTLARRLGNQVVRGQVLSCLLGSLSHGVRPAYVVCSEAKQR